MRPIPLTRTYRAKNNINGVPRVAAASKGISVTAPLATIANHLRRLSPVITPSHVRQAIAAASKKALLTSNRAFLIRDVMG